MPEIYSPEIKSFVSLLEKELSKLDFGKNPKELYEPINYTLSMGGKRIRPLLVLLGCDLFGGNVGKNIYPALAIEVFHNFTLVHDDIMDNAPLRRNMPTVFKKWNKNIALLSGDVMLVLAYRLLSKCDKVLFPEILEVFNETAIRVCEGQQLDMNFEKQDAVSIEEYIEMIGLKTAVLLGGALKIGAILGGSSEKNANHIYQFGKNAGIAFQLQDDLLDVFGDTKKFGKQEGGDIIANKKTFLFLKAFERADKKNKKELSQLFSEEKVPFERKIKTVKGIYERYKIKEETEKAMNYYFSIAKKHFSKISASKNKKAKLLGFLSGLMKREM